MFIKNFVAIFIVFGCFLVFCFCFCFRSWTSDVETCINHSPWLIANSYCWALKHASLSGY